MRLSFGILAVCSGLMSVGGTASAQPRDPVQVSSGEIIVELNGITVVRPPEGTSGILISQPTVAAVRIGRSGELTMTGTAVGVTRFVFQDESGRILGEGRIRVAAPADWLLVNAGPRTYAFACSDVCMPVAPDQVAAAGQSSPTASGSTAGGSLPPGAAAMGNAGAGVLNGVGAGGAATVPTATVR